MMFFDLIEVTINPNHPQAELVSSALNLLQVLYNYSLGSANATEKRLRTDLFSNFSQLIQKTHGLHHKIHLRFSSEEDLPVQEGWDNKTSSITITVISSQIQLISKLITFLYQSLQPWLNDPTELAKILAQADSLSYFKLGLKLAAYYYHHLPQHKTLKEITTNLPLIASEIPEELQKNLSCEAWLGYDEPLSVEEFLSLESNVDAFSENDFFIQRRETNSSQKEPIRQEMIDIFNKLDHFLSTQKSEDLEFAFAPAAKRPRQLPKF